jgi:hypothetical protein
VTKTTVLLAVVLLAAPGCLVLSVNPAYDGDSIGWDPSLIGAWRDADDNSSMQIERGEWQSYRIHYIHPIENGDLTGYMTAIGDTRYLDVMPAAGVDRGSFVVPVHAVLRVQLDGDRLELTPLSYDWFADRLRARRMTPVPGLSVALDQKENALIVSPVATLRDWLRRQPQDGHMFGAAAVFERASKERPSTPNPQLARK